MALDALVDSTQLDADLTSVANAIRTKGGTSASLAFPADFVSAIAAIPTGGGSMETGTITPSSDMGTITIPLTSQPTHFMLCTGQSGFPTSNSWKVYFYAIPNWGDDCVQIIRYGPSNWNASHNSSGYSFTAGILSVTFPGSYKIPSGITYTWYAW